MQPPIAKRIPVVRELHGERFVDDYAWLRDRSDPDVIAHLEAENAYTEHATAHLAGLRTEIFEEIRSRTLETDLSAPVRRGDHWYASRTEEGMQYPVHVRMVGSPDGPEEVLLDVNALAAGHDFMAIGVFVVSPDGTRLAYSTDTDGSERFTLRIRDIASGEDLDDVVEGTYYSAAWSADGRHLFYTTIDDAQRPDTVWRHELGTVQDADVVAVHEPDERMFLSVGSTMDDRYLLVTAGSQTTADARFLDSDDPEGTWEWVIPRVEGVEYHVDHKDGRWIVATNDAAEDGRLISIAVDRPSDVVELIPHRSGRRIARPIAFEDHVVVVGRDHGLTAITVVPDGAPPFDLSFNEEVYTIRPERNLEYRSRTVRISFESMVTPPRIMDVDLVDGSHTIIKETPVLGGFTSTDYVSRRDWARAEDGARIPLSIVHRADLDQSDPLPVLLYGYGSYESSSDPRFSIPRLSLLDRGVVFVIAHVRGGGEMGRSWYEQGKLQHKANTFTDFVAAAEYLVAVGLTSPERLVARGGSAGGLLMGAVANLRPELFAGIVAHVPFVDVVNTMLDETLPLTIIEFEEWGNPKDPEHYRWIRAYSPYDNTEAREYPSMLVLAGLNDRRVSYWEPAKWVAKLRAVASNRGPLLLRTEMGAGHAGPSGRYDAWREEAFTLAFILDTLGLVERTDG
jgi:oligopeptidase B